MFGVRRVVRFAVRGGGRERERRWQVRRRLSGFEVHERRVVTRGRVSRGRGSFPVLYGTAAMATRAGGCRGCRGFH